MRLIRLALALVAVSSSWAALANPAINSNVGGAIAGTVGASVANTNGPTQMIAGQMAGRAQAHIEGGLQANLAGNLASHLRSNLGGNDTRSANAQGNGMNESIPRGWLMVLVAVLLIGHQLRRKHRFLRPHRFSDV